MSNMNEFIVNKGGRQPVGGYIPQVIESVGYGTQTATDPSTGKPGLVPLPTKIMVGPDGQEREVDNPEVYAQILKFEGDDDYVYYIRMNARGDISDPWGIYADGHQNNRAARYRGTAEYEFRRVPERPFMIFLRYLVSRNGALLRICERDIKDA